MKKTVIINVLALVLSCKAIAQKPVRFYVGSLTPGQTSLISLCELDLKQGLITRLDTFSYCKGPGYLALSPDKKVLYAATQSNELKSFRIDDKGRLTPVNSQNTAGINPCHVAIHPKGNLAFMAHYTGGSLSVLPIQEGRVQPVVFTDQYSGDGPNKPRQDKAHAHCSVVSPDGKFVYVTDLGTDRILNYTVDISAKGLQPNPEQVYFKAEPGSGPRHMVFHRSGKYLYLINELNATVNTLAVSEKGSLTLVQTLPSLPASFRGPNTAAAIRLHPSGRFLYVSNRGYNGITAFEIGKNGLLRQVDTISGNMDTPRDFNVDPSGKYLVVANMGSDDLSIYTIDGKRGTLTFKSKRIQISKPTCIVFL